MPRRIPAAPLPARPARILALAVTREQREALSRRLAALRIHAPAACDGPTLAAMLHESFYDVVLIADSDGESIREVQSALAADRCVSCIVLGAEPSMDMAVAVMRAGGVDLLERDCPDVVLRASIARASARARSLRARARREERRARKLGAACRELARSRQALVSQLGSVCSDAAAGYRDLSQQLTHVAMASELNTIFRQELDLECLLRTVLEYTLKKVGSTNAAIFLPNTAGDYTLGAYVNYDCPRDHAETLLDHLADIIAPAFESRDDIALMRGLSGLRDTPGSSGQWLEDSSVAAFSCRDPEGECLAVVVLFRDHRVPFTGTAPLALRIIRELFTQQLARVVNLHHRHQPKHQWGGFFNEEDERGMAA